MSAYQDLPYSSRLWLYQSDRPFSPEEVRKIREKGAAFINEWTAHGSKMKAALEVFHDHFIGIFADETTTEASGCSIDSSVHFIQELEQEFNIHLMDRTNVAYRKQDDTIRVVSLEKFREMTKVGMIGEETTVFNNLVTTKEEFEKNWEVPFHQSWHKQLV